MKIDSHFRISIVKSLLRILGFTVLIGSITIGALILIVAELLGVAEELYT
jgi:hypothetical protein